MRKNNRGASLITVIVVVSLAVIMVSVVLYTALLNFNMKTANLKTKDAFYTAEKAMDEIKAGLMQQESAALQEAYIYVLQHYGEMTTAQRKQEFMEKYKAALAGEIQQAGITNRYDLDKIKDYLIYTKPVYNAEGAFISGALVEATGEPELYVNPGKIILKGLKITYKDTAGSVSIIETDIALNYPDVEFEESTLLPGMGEYAVVTAQGLKAEGGTQAKVQGGVYAGEQGIQVLNGATLTIANAEKTVTPSEILVKDGSTFLIEDGSALWARNIKVEGGTLHMNGNAYVANDLILGKNASVTLEGTYYGFGNPQSAMEAEALSRTEVVDNPSDYSSAILINGVKTSLDMTGLQRLMLAGNAYVGTKKKTPSSLSNVSMGESLGIKSDQLIYLIPADCVGIGTNGETLSGGGKNPMSQEAYQELEKEVRYDLIRAYGSEADVLAGMGVADMDTAIKKSMVSYYTTVPELGKNLAEIGVNGYTCAFYPDAATTTVYLYMTFDTKEQENQYYRDYCTSNSQWVEKYLNVYSQGIQINESMEHTVLNGNLIYSMTEGFGILRDNFLLENADNQEYLKYIQKEYQNTFAALGAALNENYEMLKVEQRNRTPFENLVNESAIVTGATQVAGGDEVYIPAVTADTGFYLVNNEGESALVVDASMPCESGILVTTGDVVVKENFQGLIIAKGKITLQGSAQIIADGGLALEALLAKDSGTGRTALDYLNYTGGSASGGSSAGAEDIDLSGLITFENWKKK